MEVTDLKELKKLMKGEARNKFEFEEEDDEDAVYGGSSMAAFTYAAENKKQVAGTYKMSQQQNSIQVNTGQELSSSDSELIGQDDYNGGDDFNDDYLYDEDVGNRTKSSENKVTKHLLLLFLDLLSLQGPQEPNHIDPRGRRRSR